MLREVWLVIDGSGSMGGLPAEQARDAALFFVKDLPHGQSARKILTADPMGAAIISSSTFRDCQA